MNWSDLLMREIEYTYRLTNGLFNLVDETMLDWKPATGNNWMTTGQLLMHITNACGAAIRGFVTGDWGLPKGVDLSDLSPEQMLPPAAKMPAIETVAKAKILLAADKQLAIDMLEKCKEDDLANQMTTAPWDSSKMILGHRLLQMISHLSHHKSQLFYYLKLQGKDVNTDHLWGAVEQ